MQETFADIFEEYYSIFRGQATSIPVYGDPEFALGIQLCRNAIRKWARADGTLWVELIDTVQRQDISIVPLVAKTISGVTLSYAAPTNMRKPPSRVSFYSGGQQSWQPVIKLADTEKFSELSGHVAFVGSANKGWTMLVPQALATQYNGFTVDYIYNKNPLLPTEATDPSDFVFEISDVNFLIQEMLAARYANERNGFGYKVAKKDATDALRNMRVENDSGVQNTINILEGAMGWGAPNNNTDIQL